MKHKLFYKFGQLIYKLRWFLVSVWVLIILSCIPLLPHIISPFKTTGFVDINSKSEKTTQYLDKKLGYNGYNKFLILYTSKTLVATDPLFDQKIKKSLSGLNKFPIKHDIIYPNQNTKQISKDKHSAYVVIILKLKKQINTPLLTQFKAAIKKPTHMKMQMGGEPIFVDDINRQTEKDLYKADAIATPIAIVTLVIIFGTFIAAILPIILGGGCALMILANLYWLGHLFTLSIFTLNIALLLGLCLSLDYSLFIISRFRDELQSEPSIKQAIANTQATAGKAILFSGLAVFVSLSALLFFPINILFSVAVGGLVAVLMAMITALIFLPAILAILNTKINLLPVTLTKQNKPMQLSGLHWLTTKVVQNPLRFFFSILTLLLLLGYPFLSVKLGVSDFHIFPKHSNNRSFFDTYSKKFNPIELTPILMVIKTPKHSILSAHNLSRLYKLTHQLKNNQLIREVNSIVTTNPQLTNNQYFKLYNMPKSLMSLDIKQLLDTTTRTHFTVIDIISKDKSNSPNTTKLIHQLQNLKVGSGMTMSLTGAPVSNIEMLKSIAHLVPYAMIWIMIFTYLILLILLRSLFLPLKAIVMNVLSLSACFGALVFVFQEGHLHNLLMFEPQGMLDISLLVIIFCAIFGFSMDYEVFLLSRIKESYTSNHDNQKSIVFGIKKSCQIITSAAIIVIFICCSFLVAEVLMVKAFGLGIAVAIFVDAFLIRTILVPATMSFLKSWNWYLPKWLDKILPK